MKGISGQIFKNYKVDRVIRSKENVKVTIGSEHLNYDQIVLATHADQSLAMLDEPSDDENRILGKFRYVSNNAVLHTDQRFMPNKKLLGLAGIQYQVIIKLV